MLPNSFFQCARKIVQVSVVVALMITASTAEAAKPPQVAVDFTKPHDPNNKGQLYNVGPTGLLGYYNMAARSHQIRVQQIAEGSPAYGKIKQYDVIVGINGVPFQKGGNIIEAFGNAIDEAEKKENGGKLTLSIWRDANAANRVALRRVNAETIDVTDFIEVIQADDSADLDRYRSEKQLAARAETEWKEEYEKYPILESTHEITLTLEVMGTYSETSPWECPKVAKIRENAYPYLIKEMKKGIGGWDKHMVPLALLATGVPEHMELVKAEFHKALPKMRPGGGSWSGGYVLTFMGEYYHRTKDESMLPLLEKTAHNVSRIQTPGGAWGHGGADMMRSWLDPYGPTVPMTCGGNYGEMNQAGGPCFLGQALAKMAGIKDPVLDLGLQRSIRYNTTWVDKGGAPYGYHPPVVKAGNNNNGKNGPPGLAMSVLGQSYKAQYFGLYSAAEAATGFSSGHGDGTFSRLWPQLCSSMAGPEVVQTWMRKMRPYYTMSRQYDGTFVQPSSGMGLGIGSLFDPTGMAILHYSMPMAKLYITGRDVPPENYASEKDLQHLREKMIRIKPEELSDDQLIDRLDTFDVYNRRKFEAELAKRYESGSSSIIPKIKNMMNHQDLRVREAVLNIYAKVDRATIEEAVFDVTNLLQDSSDVVRCAAVKCIQAYVSGKPDRLGKRPGRIEPFLEKLVESAITDFPDPPSDLINYRAALINLMLNTDNAFAREPFRQGLDSEKVRYALELFAQVDPRYDITKGHLKEWDRDTCIQAAGMLVFLASERDLNGKMFGGQALRPTRNLLAKHKFIESAEAKFHHAYTAHRIPRGLQHSHGMGYKLSTMSFDGTRGLGKSVVPDLRAIMVDHMNLEINESKTKSYPINEVIIRIEDTETPTGWSRLSDEAIQRFLKEADAVGDDQAQIAFCRSQLNPERLNYFRQMGAMTRLVQLRGADAVQDLVPYINHENWRMHDHSRKLIRELKGEAAGKALLALSRHSDPAIAAAALEMMGERGDKVGVAPALTLMATHTNPRVRGAAAQAVYGGSNGKELGKLLGRMKSLSDPEEINGFENALLMALDDSQQSRIVAASARKYMDIYPVPVKRSLYYVLGQIGGKENLDYLMSRLGPGSLEYDEKKRLRSKETQEFSDIVTAISYSPDISATQTTLDILSQFKGTDQQALISGIIAKRVVNGGEVIGKVPPDVNLDFAEAHLATHRNTGIIKYMGNISTRRSFELMLKYMQLGPESVTQTASKALNQAASKVTKSVPIEDRKAMANALKQVLEYITVVRLKGSRYVDKENKRLMVWKKLADSTAAHMNRIYSPDEMLLQVPGPAVNPANSGNSPGKNPVILGPPPEEEEDIDI